MHIYPVQMYPLLQLTIDLCNTTTPVKSYSHPLLIKPSASEPYYTMSIWHVEVCRHTQMRCIPPIKPSAAEPYNTISMWDVEKCRCTQVRYNLHPHHPHELHLMLQNPTTSCQFDMWNNAGLPKSNIHPLLIWPSATHLYYTMSLWYVQECR